MGKSNNSDPFRCLQNLLSMYQNECPMSREKGIDSRVIDRPMTGPEILDETVTDLIGDYEPRLTDAELNIDLNEEEGDFRVTVNVVPAQEGEEEDNVV